MGGVVAAHQFDGVFEAAQVDEVHVQSEEHRADDQPQHHQRQARAEHFDAEKHHLADERRDRRGERVDGGVDAGRRFRFGRGRHDAVDPRAVAERRVFDAFNPRLGRRQRAVALSLRLSLRCSRRGRDERGGGGDDGGGAQRGETTVDGNSVHERSLSWLGFIRARGAME